MPSNEESTILPQASRSIVREAQDRLGAYGEQSETLAKTNERIERILGANGMAKLHKGAKPNSPESMVARNAFVQYLLGLKRNGKGGILGDTTKDHRSRYTENPENDPRLREPEKHTTSMGKLLDKEGMRLYKAAVKEERESIEYRNAVFLAATKSYRGPALQDRVVCAIGGPSGSGKSFSAERIMEKLIEAEEEKLGVKNNDSNTINTVISIDGGIERGVSQMRQLVLSTAIRKGWTGIQDLHTHTKLDAKWKVQSAVLASKEPIHLMIPQTFTNPLDKFKLIKKFLGVKDRKLIFCEIVGKDEEQFKQTVERQGNARAWYNFSNKTKVDITPNNRDIGCESKQYQAKYFLLGLASSRDAREFYKSIYKNGLYIPVTNDVVFLKENKEKNTWEICENKNDVSFVKMSERAFDKWKEERAKWEKENNSIDTFPDPHDWLKAKEAECKKTGKVYELSQPLVGKPEEVNPDKLEKKRSSTGAVLGALRDTVAQGRTFLFKRSSPKSEAPLDSNSTRDKNTTEKKSVSDKKSLPIEQVDISPSRGRRPM